MHHRNFLSSLFSDTTLSQIPGPALLVGSVGCVLWAVAYILVIVTGFRQKTYGIPMAAICMNVTWEVLSVWGWPAVKNDPGFYYADIAWLSMDLVIVSQLLFYGRKEQIIPELRTYFYPVVAGSLILAYLGQYTFPLTYDDPRGFVLAFIINMGMSILFVFMFYARPEKRGLSLPIAWLKMLGTLCESIMCVWWMKANHPDISDFSFFYFLYVTTFLFDCIYISQLWRARSLSAAGAE